jgi:hypothetical protein
MAVQQVRSPGGATEAKQDAVLAALGVVLTELQQKLETGQAVALDAPTLAALETITTAVSNFPADYPDDAAAALLADIKTVLEGTLDVSGTVVLDASALAALENITATIANWPVEFPLPAAQVATLTPQTDALTDDELRATPVPVSGTVTVNEPVTVDGVQTDALTDDELRAAPVPVSGTVSVNEPVTVDGTQLDALTDEELRAADVDTADSGEREYTHVVATITNTGDTTIHTPAAGKAIRLRWIYAISDPAAETPPLIKVKIGALELYRVYALSKRQRKTGAVDAPLVINLSDAGSVAVTAILEEV